MRTSLSSILSGIRPLCYLAAVSLGYRHELICAELVAILLLFSLWIGGWKRGEVRLALIVGSLGPLAESVAINFGSWHYQVTSIFVFPLWLPFVWAGAALFIVRLGKRLHA